MGASHASHASHDHDVEDDADPYGVPSLPSRRRVYDRVPGLVNEGQSCFVNATLQVQFACAERGQRCGRRVACRRAR